MLEEKDSQHLVDALNPYFGFTVDFYVLLERRLGPFQVIGNKGNTCSLFNLATKKEFTTNVSRMVPFYFDANRVDSQSVAAHDSNELIDESVLEHEKSLLFKLRWLGYDASHDTWEPWKNLHSVDKLHSYLKEIGHPNEIPRRFN